MKGYNVYSKIQQFRQAGFSQRQVARRLGINRKTVKRYWEMPVNEYEEMSSAICRMQYLDKYQTQIIQKYIEDASGAARNSKTMLELNTLAMKSRISQKERLLANIYQNMIDLAGDSNAKLESLLGDILKVNYYESCFAVQRGVGLGFNVAKIDNKLVRQVLSFPWSEKHFSEAVWGACDHLSALTRREITLGFIQGSSVQKMAKAVNDVMDKGRYNAERLVRTECKYFANQGELMAYKENGIKRYRFIGGTEGSGGCTIEIAHAGFGLFRERHRWDKKVRAITIRAIDLTG